MEKYTIVLLHYNQMEYIEEAIISVMKQDYKNIELIIADDCSPQFDYKKIEKMIKKHNKHNFEYKILSMKKNSGTVKNLNSAIKKATGDFIHFLASDDALYNSKVVSRFVKEFKDKNKNIITAQCIMCDEKLKGHKTYVDSKLANKLNKKGVSALFEKMSEYCIYCAGATVYRTKVLKKYKLFDEKYKYIEDWTAWLNLTRNGEMMHYVDFIAFKHRDGGISHSEYTQSTLPAHVRGYYKDLLEGTVNETLPFINEYKISEQYRIVKKFQDCINYFGRFAPEMYDYHKYIVAKKSENKKFAYYWKLKTLENIFVVSLIEKVKHLFTHNIIVPITFIIWLFTCFVINLCVTFKSNDMVLMTYIVLYIVYYILIYDIKQLFSLKKDLKKYKQK